jgi:hypothetical protein
MKLKKRNKRNLTELLNKEEKRKSIKIQIRLLEI